MAKKETASQATAKKKKSAEEAKAFTAPARLKLKYDEEVAGQLKEKFSYKNVMEIPKLEKIVLNMRLGSDKDNPKAIEAAVPGLKRFLSCLRRKLRMATETSPKSISTGHGL